MVGKIKRVRHKLHQDAVKINPEQKTLGHNEEKALPSLPWNTFTKPETQEKCNEPGRGVKVSVCFNEELVSVGLLLLAEGCLYWYCWDAITFSHVHMLLHQ